MKAYNIPPKKRPWIFRWLRAEIGLDSLALEFYKHDHKESQEKQSSKEGERWNQ